MRFSFPFEALLNWKRTLEELAEIRLARRRKELQSQEIMIQRVVKQRSVNEKEMMEKLRRDMSVSEYVVYKLHQEESYEELLRREEEKQQTIQEIEAEQKNLIALMKQKKILEKLKDKKFKKFLYEMDKLDQKASDERVIVTYQSTREREPS